jgi:hypothetical protein
MSAILSEDTMPIPQVDEAGYLPPGIHDATLDEVEERFGGFQRSDRRMRLFAKLKEYVKEVRRTGMAVTLLIDGSFVTSKPEPNDIDLLLVLKPDHDWTAVLRPFEYNAITKPGVRRMYRFDLFAVQMGSPDYEKRVAFFQQVRDHPDRRKGIVRVWL